MSSPNLPLEGPSIGGIARKVSGGSPPTRARVQKCSWTKVALHFLIDYPEEAGIAAGLASKMTTTLASSAGGRGGVGSSSYVRGSVLH